MKPALTLRIHGPARRPRPRRHQPDGPRRARCLLLSCTLALGAAACGERRAAEQRTNVVVIVIDTLRADRLPFYDESRNTAPFLAALAREGLVFDNAWSTSSWTAPATASIFTGLYPNQHGVQLGLRAGRAREGHDQEYELNRIPDELETLPSFMQRLGYRTFGASANPNIDARLGFERGFDRFAPFDPKDGKGAGPLREKVLSWKQEILASQPYFLYLHLADPHGPYQRHDRFIDSPEPPPENRMDDIVAYDSEIRFADEQLRTIFEELGIGNETLVIMTADHGQEFLDHGQRGHGWQLYSELTHVPLFIHHASDPRIRGRVAANVTNASILATLRDLLGEPAGNAGASLLDVERDALGRRHAFSMRTHQGARGTTHLHSVVAGRYKLILHEVDDRSELYDLVADPKEQRDLASAMPELTAELRRAIETQQERAARTSVESRQTFSPSPELIDLLEELGYAEDGVNTGGP